MAILLDQRPETAYSHIAVYKLGAIAVPLFALFGQDALLYRLQNSGAKAVITDRPGAEKLAGLRASLPGLETVFVVDSVLPGCVDFAAETARHAEEFGPVETKADDPAIIIYTSGTTGPPKGALHAHRVLLGHLPGVELSHEFLPQTADRFWTPADWAWIGGLYDVLMPAWHHGITVVSHRFSKFNANEAFQLIEDFAVRNVFLPPTALKMMRQVEMPAGRWTHSLRSLASGGEALGAELLEWGRKTFGLTINEFYGQTECNMVISSCSRIMEARPGVTGRAVPGHRVAVVDSRGEEMPHGELGNIAVANPDPVMFLGYWQNAEATREKFAGPWLLTGDIGRQCDDGYIQFIGRNDDVITTAGYRIGPGEIEDCLLGHPAVSMAAVVGVPDPLRTQLVKALIVLHEHVQGSDLLKKEIQQYVRKRLAAHEYPREIEFVADLPVTSTGKIIRRELRERD